MDHFRERLIAHLEEEISLLKEADFPINELCRSEAYFFKRDSYRLRELQEQIHQLSKQVHELADRRAICALSDKSEEHDGVMQLLIGLPNKAKKENTWTVNCMAQRN
ncbi:hypothetical protein [Aeromonas veronii]|uniref:hypothetical protein n=1 Tax=Aeromonas veronii TaxID=654 RepID=UPI00191D1C75|nr:hypothetical protein [Aeromonas veronii]MBL0475244.1 hypothetical protein [Aeromonas veronii]MCX0440767.1 hypothetical protein [Aeromonas veronii]